MKYLAILLVLGAVGVVAYTAFTKTPSDKTSTPTEHTNSQTSSTTDTQKVDQNTVEIKGFAYEPRELIIKAGTTVTFINRDAVAHTATADNKSFDTGLISQGESVQVKFDKQGTYSYFCKPHPYMKGEVTVE